MSIKNTLAGETVYEAIAEDLTHLGGPMGSEYTTEKSLGIFTTNLGARLKCEKHFKAPLKWKNNRTEDLGWVMYYIRAKKVG